MLVQKNLAPLDYFFLGRQRYLFGITAVGVGAPSGGNATDHSDDTTSLADSHLEDRKL